MPLLRVALTNALLIPALLGMPSPAAGQELIHHGQDGLRSTEQTVELIDAWGQPPQGGYFTATPSDVLIRVQERRLGGEESTTAQLLLAGDWGWFHLSVVEFSIEEGEARNQGTRTAWFGLDIDADGENELVLVERRVETGRALDEGGNPEAGSLPRLTELSVDVRYLDRFEGNLIERSVTTVPDNPEFAALLERELGGPTYAALQLAAADELFVTERYVEARYRYLIVKEWAERALPGRAVPDLDVDMAIRQPDPDDPSLAWVMALRRFASLPPYYRRLP